MFTQVQLPNYNPTAGKPVYTTKRIVQEYQLHHDVDYFFVELDQVDGVSGFGFLREMMANIYICIYNLTNLPISLLSQLHFIICADILYNMQKAKRVVENLTSQDGRHDTTVDEEARRPVTEEHVRPQEHESVRTAVEKEVHRDHHHTMVQPVQDRQTLSVNSYRDCLDASLLTLYI